MFDSGTCAIRLPAVPAAAGAGADNTAGASSDMTVTYTEKKLRPSYGVAFLIKMGLAGICLIADDRIHSAYGYDHRKDSSMRLNHPPAATAREPGWLA